MPDSGAQLTLKAGNAPVAPLVLHGVVGGGNHLQSGDPNARLPCLFHKKREEELSINAGILTKLLNEIFKFELFFYDFNTDVLTLIEDKALTSINITFRC